MSEEITSLKNSKWLASRLGLSLTSIERSRTKKSADTPPYIKINSSIRYDELTVEKWLAEKLQANTPKEINSTKDQEVANV
jgi:hypothetical protein